MNYKAHLKTTDVEIKMLYRRYKTELKQNKRLENIQTHPNVQMKKLHPPEELNKNNNNQ